MHIVCRLFPNTTNTYTRPRTRTGTRAHKWAGMTHSLVSSVRLVKNPAGTSLMLFPRRYLMHSKDIPSQESRLIRKNQMHRYECISHWSFIQINIILVVILLPSSSWRTQNLWLEAAKTLECLYYLIQMSLILKCVFLLPSLLSTPLKFSLLSGVVLQQILWLLALHSTSHHQESRSTALLETSISVVVQNFKTLPYKENANSSLTHKISSSGVHVKAFP